MEVSDPDALDRYALVGHPVEHSRSPVIHALFARQTGERVSYELIDAEPANFETAVRGFKAAGGKGLNVTVPHKEAAFQLSDQTGDEAARARASNTLSFLPDGQIRGDNTDGIGFVRDLEINHGQDLAGRRILLLGAGGAARGILGPLLDEKPSELILANRTSQRAEQLVAQFSTGPNGAPRACSFAELDEMDPFDVLINATSAGLKGENPPFSAHCVSPKSFCYDLAYSLNDTPFVLWARHHSARKAVQGWGMLIEQAAESFCIWRGVRPETSPILERLTVR